MTDDGIRFGEMDDAADAAAFDAEPHPDVTAALADLTHLRPDLDPTLPTPPEPMPDWAWDRLSTTLANEASLRAAELHENVIAFAPAAAAKQDPAPAVGPSRVVRWAGGLVAASVAVVAVGVGVTVLRSGATDTAIVAGDAPVVTASVLSKSAPATTPEAAAAEAAPVATAFSAPSADGAPAPQSSAPAPVTETPQASPGLRSGGSGPTIPAAKMVMASGTNYTSAALQTQVIDLLDQVGADNPDMAAALPEQAPAAWPVGTGGFTASMSSLRDCITSLTQSPEVQALVVDHSTYQGADAGVVVAPALFRSDAATPSPTATIDTNMGRLDVWVVNPDCSTVDRKVLQYLLDQWRG